MCWTVGQTHTGAGEFLLVMEALEGGKELVGKFHIKAGPVVANEERARAFVEAEFLHTTGYRRIRSHGAPALDGCYPIFFPASGPTDWS